MTNPLQNLPSVDRVLALPMLKPTIEQFGLPRTTAVIRSVIDEQRTAIRRNAEPGTVLPAEDIAADVSQRLQAADRARLVSVFNLTGTILHTNLGRAYLPPTAIEAVTLVAAGASNLEYDLGTGNRGDRDDHIESLICELTGAEAATVVNNNAAAVLLTLNTLALAKEVCVSRGELVEIGGSFRIPEIMSRSGCRLIEVGSTNRTHLQDYEGAITADTGAVMKVHTSNYEIMGFTSAVTYDALAGLAQKRGIPFLVDLGSGTLVNLDDLGLAQHERHEPTVAEVLSSGADLVTFSGDKLLGGPQAGIIAGRKSLIREIKQNPLKRALRVDKMTIAALAEVLKLYRNPATLQTQLPTMRFLGRSADDIKSIAINLLPAFTKALTGFASASVMPTNSQIGSGALPIDTLPSYAIVITPSEPGDRALQSITQAFRQLSKPVIGRLKDGKLLFDMRTVDNHEELETVLATLSLSSPR